MTIMQSIPVPPTADDVCDLVAFIEAKIEEGVDAVELGPTDAALCVEALRALVGSASLFSRSQERLDRTVRK